MTNTIGMPTVEIDSHLAARQGRGWKEPDLRDPVAYLCRKGRMCVALMRTQ